MFAHVDCDAVCSRWAAKQAPISPEGPSFFFSFLPPPPSLSPTCFSRDILSETARRPRWLSHVPAEEGDGKEKTSWRDRNRVYSLRLILFLCSLLSKGFYNVLGTWSLSLRLALVLKILSIQLNLNSVLKPDQRQAPRMTCGLPTGQGRVSLSAPGGRLWRTTRGASLLACLKLATLSRGNISCSCFSPVAQTHDYQATVNPPPPLGVQ